MFGLGKALGVDIHKLAESIGLEVVKIELLKGKTIIVVKVNNDEFKLEVSSNEEEEKKA